MEKNSENKTYRIAKEKMALYFVMDFVLLFAYGLGVIIFILHILIYFNYLLTITPSAVLVKRGIIITNTVEIPFNKINSMTIRKGIFAGLFGYGDILILSGNDVQGVKFPNINNPEELKKEILSLADVKDKAVENKNLQSQTSYSELNELAQLKEKGVITEQEFEQKKKQILGIV